MTASPLKERILVVDDSTATLEVLNRNLRIAGYQVFTALSVPEAVEILNTTELDLVISDLKMPKISGLELVRHIKENFKNTEVMMITGYPSIEGAVDAVKTGAQEFLAKPFTDSELLSVVQRVLKKLQLRKTGNNQSKNLRNEHVGLIGTSEPMKKVFGAINKVALTSATVLITGESGTGKELAARAIHYNGPRSSSPFIAVNCGGIPEGLLESELFGHVKGAFTGAVESRAGFFHSADGGTIFLDEVSEMSMPMQVKLLRVLQDKEVCMVGSSRTRKVDVRVLAATNKDLRILVQKGLFREDLFYRLNVISIFIPPLAQRGGDILLLANHFITKFSNELGKTPPRLSDEVIQNLCDYGWPGNIRELENLMQRLVIMTDDVNVNVSDLPHLMRFSANRKNGFTRSLAEVEKEYINNVLSSVGGNITKASEILRIDRKTLREKIKKPINRS